MSPIFDELCLYLQTRGYIHWSLVVLTHLVLLWWACKVIGCLLKKLIYRRVELTTLGEWAIITGCTDGIGKAVAKTLVEEKKFKKIIIVGRNQQKLKDTENELRLVGPTDLEVQQLQCDFATDDVYAAVSAAVKGKDIGLLMNNAGIGYPHASFFDELDPALVDDMVRVNVTAVMLSTLAVLPGMKARKSGMIVCIGSGLAALPCGAMYSAYAGTKAAVDSFINSLQVELQGTGVIVSCQEPLMVVSKLSKAKKPGSIIASTEGFAHCSIKAMETQQGPDVYPWWRHRIVIYIANILPRYIYDWMAMRDALDIRTRALRKLAKAKKSS